MRSSPISLMSNNGRELNFYISFCIQSVVTCSFCVHECSVVSDSATPWTAAHQALLPTEIFQARILKWVVISYYTGSSQLRDGTHVSCIGRRILYHLSHQVIPHALLVNVYKEN